MNGNYLAVGHPSLTGGIAVSTSQQEGPGFEPQGGRRVGCLRGVCLLTPTTLIRMHHKKQKFLQVNTPALPITQARALRMEMLLFGSPGLLARIGGIQSVVPWDQLVYIQQLNLNQICRPLQLHLCMHLRLLRSHQHCFCINQHYRFIRSNVMYRTE